MSKANKNRYILVEYCDMCPHVGVDDTNEEEGVIKPTCEHEKMGEKPIPAAQYTDGYIPDWCPLPVEGPEGRT